MSFTVQDFSSNIITVSQQTITLTFAAPIQAGETVGIFATYIGALGAGSCADGLANPFQLGDTVTGSGWTKTAFYYLNHPGGTSTVIFTAPGVIVNKGIVGWRVSATGTIQYISSDCVSSVAPGVVVDALTTVNFSTNADALLLGSAINLGAASTLQIGTNFITNGGIWSNFGLAENRSIALAGNYPVTFTTTDGAGLFLSAGLALQVVSGATGMSINDDILFVTGGPTVNDGLLAFYLANGAVTATLVDSEYEFLIARGITATAKNDMWYAFLTTIVSLPMSGALQDMKANWWANGAPLI